MSERESLSLRWEVARKTLHAATVVFPLCLSFGWSTQGALRILLTAAAVAALGVEALRRFWPRFSLRFANVFGSMLRAPERSQFTGATWLAISMALVLWLAPLNAAIASLWALALGDASAAVLGRTLGRVERRAPNEKTLIGSLAALVVTALGVFWLTPTTAGLALLIGVVAAAAERPRGPLDDNLRIAVAVALAATVLGLS